VDCRLWESVTPSKSIMPRHTRAKKATLAKRNNAVRSTPMPMRDLSSVPETVLDARTRRGGAEHSRALVLGAGGPVGRAWEAGLVAGLIQQGIDLGDASLIIGTSAGAIIGAQLALGLKFVAPEKLDPDMLAAPASTSGDLPGLLGAIAQAVRSSKPEAERAKIGARHQSGDPERRGFHRPGGVRQDPRTCLAEAVPRDCGGCTHREASRLRCIIRRAP
jgi:hypothetical protein